MKRGLELSIGPILVALVAAMLGSLALFSIAVGLSLAYVGLYLAVRKAAGLFDISHMGKFCLRGPNLLEQLQLGGALLLQHLHHARVVGRCRGGLLLSDTKVAKTQGYKKIAGFPCLACAQILETRSRASPSNTRICWLPHTKPSHFLECLSLYTHYP